MSTARSLELAFEQDGPTLAFELFLVVGLESALFATGSILFAVAAATRERAVEAVALRSVGLPRRTLVGAMAGELGIVVPRPGSSPAPWRGSRRPISRCTRCPSSPGSRRGRRSSSTCRSAGSSVVVAGAAALLAFAVAVSIGVVSAASTPDKLRISQR